MTPRFTIMLLAAAVLIAAPLAALAQPKSGEYTYRCTGSDGRKYYGSAIPNACIGRPLELINKQGLVVKRIDPEGDEKAKIAKEAEAEKKREADAATREANLRNRALLATYTSEKDIEDSRQRDLRNHAPTRLKEEITNAEIDLKAQETLLDAKKKEALGINARYDEDKRRYKEAVGRK
jgi:hypothetical protein